MHFARLTLVAALALAALAPGQAPGRTRTIVATIVDARGAPLAGAGLAAGALADLATQDALDKPVARSGADGRLTAKLAYGPFEDYASVPALLIAAPGKAALATGFVQGLSSPEPDATVDLGYIVLLDGTTLRGRIVDAAGKPVAGARVTAAEALALSGYLPLPGDAMTCRATALSDAKGLFALPGCHDRALDLTFTKDGWYQRRLRPVGRETPLTVEMKPSGFVAGKVLGADGHGIRGVALTITWECGAYTNLATGQDGTFRTTVLQPGRYRIRGNCIVASGTQQIQSPILEGPREGIELRAAGDEGVRVVVRAVDGAGKKAIEEFSAVGWWNAGQMSAGEVLMHLGSRLVPCGKDHRVTLVPQEPQRNGRIVVTAPGHAPEAVAVSLGDADTPKELTVELGPESTVSGKVVDEKGEGLAGVRLWAVGSRPGSSGSYGTIPKNTVLSAADGTFRLGGVGAGQWCVQGLRDDLLVPDAERVDLEAAKAREGVVIRMRAPTSLRVKASGGATDPSWTLWLEDPNQGRSSPMGPVGGPGIKFVAGSQVLAARPGPDGTFTFAKLDPKIEYRMTLLQACSGRFSRFLQLPAGTVKLPRGEPLELDLASCKPGTIKGKVDTGTSGIPMDRLVLLATPHFDPRAGQPMLNRAVYGASTPDASGAFTIAVAPGSQDLCVLDAGTGQILWEAQEATLAKAGQTAEVQVELRATAVRLQLVPAAAKEASRLAAVTVNASTAGRAQTHDYARQMILGGRWEGTPIEPDQAELELWLRPGDYTIKVTSRAGHLVAGNRYMATELANEQIDVPEKGPLEVKLTLSAPPSTEELAGK